MRLKIKGRFVDVPCGKCPACLSNRRQMWSFRLNEELKNSSSALFLTLTYDDDHLPADGNLVKSDLTLFLKRLREYDTRVIQTMTDGSKVSQNAQNRSKFRYFAVGEYGEQFNRPHYHALVFNLSNEIMLRMDEIWSKGFVKIGTVSGASINYVCKYMINKDETEMRIPQFSVMSQGIGRSYLTEEVKRYHIKGEKFSVNSGGNMLTIPRYYKDKIFNPLIKQKHAQQVSQKISQLESKNIDRILNSKESFGLHQFEADRQLRNRIKNKSKKGKL